MFDIKQLTLRISTIIFGSLISISALSLILYFFDDSIKYGFFVFAALLVGIFVLMSFRSKYELRATSPYVFKIVDLVLIGCSVVVFVFVSMLEETSNILIPFSIILSFFLPGWVLLRLLNTTSLQIPSFAILPLSFSVS